MRVLTNINKTRRNFMRSHFKEPTQKQLDKQWLKKQAVLGYQRMLQAMPRNTTKEILAWDRVFQTWAKMTGAFVPDNTVNVANNLLVVTRAEDDDAWQRQARQQQHDLRQRTKVAADTLLNTRDSG